MDHLDRIIKKIKGFSHRCRNEYQEECLFLLKGKPSERMGRKASGLSPPEGDKVAGLQSKYNNKPVSFFRRRVFFANL
jgi:hypothetical protein